MSGNNVQDKSERLEAHLKDLGSLAVAFSGGVDSSFLLAAAHKVLKDRVLAITCTAEMVPEREQNEAGSFCKERGIRQISFRTDPFEEEHFRYNDPDRCYYCKRRIFTEIKRIAEENGFAHVAEGSNMDDLGDYRPGMRAVEELKIESPLREAGLYKNEIRFLSKELGLPSWNKPAYACLASRFVYGEEITKEKLHMVEQAEQFLIDHGFPEERVRMHGNLARIEVPAGNIARLSSDEFRPALYEEFKKIGFQFVTLDMGGYRMGSMNTTITKEFQK